MDILAITEKKCFDFFSMHPFFRGPLCNEAYTLTFGDCAENERGMQIIGKSASKGMSVAQLKELATKLASLGIECELIDLRQLLPEEDTTDAAVLVLRNGVDGLLNGGEDAVYKELRSMPKDKTYLNQFGKVVNKHARHNNTMSNYHQEPDIANGKGTVVDFKDYPMTAKLRDAIADLISYPSLVGELNHYFDADKGSINYHGDEERKIVVGARFGYGANGFLLKFQWYKDKMPIGKEGILILKAGDVYVMSEKAVGFDTWKNQWIPTLRHAAGKDKKRKLGDEAMVLYK